MKLQLATFNKIINVDLPEEDIKYFMMITQSLEKYYKYQHNEKDDIW